MLTKVVAEDPDPSKVSVREFMTRSPVTCSPDYSVLRKMSNQKYLGNEITLTKINSLSGDNAF